MKTVGDELRGIANFLFRVARDEHATASPERMLALGLAFGSVMKAVEEWAPGLEVWHPVPPGDEGSEEGGR
jgi:hypothetical protein